jgi:hypothetical protein
VPAFLSITNGQNKAERVRRMLNLALGLDALQAAPDRWLFYLDSQVT